jgi:hypothetical protein
MLSGLPLLVCQSPETVCQSFGLEEGRHHLFWCVDMFIFHLKDDESREMKMSH